LFTPQERLVFGPVPLAGGQVSFDPLRVYRRLMAALGGKANDTLEASRSEDVPVRLAATEQLLGGIRHAFELADFDPATGGGVTDDEALTLLDGYLFWLDQKKTVTGLGSNWPIWSPPTPG
jgi:hypothetical protein